MTANEALMCGDRGFTNGMDEMAAVSGGSALSYCFLKCYAGLNFAGEYLSIMIF